MLLAWTKLRLVQANEKNMNNTLASGDADDAVADQQDKDPDDSEESTAVDAPTCAAYIRMACTVRKFFLFTLTNKAQSIFLTQEWKRARTVSDLSLELKCPRLRGALQRFLFRAIPTTIPGVQMRFPYVNVHCTMAG